MFCGPDSCFGRYTRKDLYSPTTGLRVRHLKFMISGKSSLCAIIVIFADGLCEDPRDKIFGLAGLVCDFPPRVDYSASTVSVFAEVSILAAIIPRVTPEGCDAGAQCLALRALERELRGIGDGGHSLELADDLKLCTKWVQSDELNAVFSLLRRYVSPDGLHYLETQAPHFFQQFNQRYEL